MSDRVSRRRMMQAAGVAAVAPVALSGAPVTWPPAVGANAPRICLGVPPAADEKTLRNLRQIGVDYVLMGGPKVPWEEAELRARMDRFKAAGIQIINMMISGFNDVIWGRPGADAQIENVVRSIRAAGKVGLPVIEYNFYAHRLIEGYKEEIGRGGAGYTAYDYELSKNLPPLENVGTHKRSDQLRRAEHFL
ncbi:MAG TPA: mannonate dehydratase, partial [Bryobacteraceae bacterium]|nr:mannonate dehydratase [Bryobacteraceae bacterium]